MALPHLLLLSRAAARLRAGWPLCRCRKRRGAWMLAGEAAAWRCISCKPPSHLLHSILRVCCIYCMHFSYSSHTPADCRIADVERCIISKLWRAPHSCGCGLRCFQPQQVATHATKASMELRCDSWQPHLHGACISSSAAVCCLACRGPGSTCLQSAITPLPTLDPLCHSPSHTHLLLSDELVLRTQP